MLLPVIETERLLLRPPVLDDAQGIFDAYASDEEATRYLVWLAHDSVDSVRLFLSQALKGLANGTTYLWAITRRSADGTSGELIGMIGLDLSAMPHNAHRASMGYVLSRRQWGRGLMTEAVSAVVDWALRDRGSTDRADTVPLAGGGFERVWAVCHVDHSASARVMEKAGMQREGLLRKWIRFPSLGNEACDCWCYARVR